MIGVMHRTEKRKKNQISEGRSALFWQKQKHWRFQPYRFWLINITAPPPAQHTSISGNELYYRPQPAVIPDVHFEEPGATFEELRRLLMEGRRERDLVLQNGQQTKKQNREEEDPSCPK